MPEHRTPIDVPPFRAMLKPCQMSCNTSRPNPVTAPDTPDSGIVLWPHRSLSRRGFKILMLVLAGPMFCIGLGFFLAGAWPVIGFLGLEIFVVWLAFRMNFRAARQRETLRANPQTFALNAQTPAAKPKSRRCRQHGCRPGSSKTPNGRIPKPKSWLSAAMARKPKSALSCINQKRNSCCRKSTRCSTRSSSNHSTSCMVKRPASPLVAAHCAARNAPRAKIIRSVARWVSSIRSDWP